MHQDFVFHRAPDQSPVCRFVGRQILRQQGEPARARVANQPRQEPRAAGIRDEPNARKRLDESCFETGDHDVAGERDVAAGAGGNAVDRRDHREGQVRRLANERIVIRLQRAAEHGRFTRLGKPIAQILAVAEAAAGAGDHQRTAIFIGFRVFDRLAQSLMHRFVEGVELVRPVEGDHAITGARSTRIGGSAVMTC